MSEGKGVVQAPIFAGQDHDDIAPVRVLVQDPHSLVRGALRQVIEAQPFAKVVCEAETPGEAMLRIRAARPDVAFIDMGGNGRTIASIEGIAKSFPECRIICMADGVSEEVIRDAFKAGATGFALKGESADQTMLAFQQVRRGNAALAGDAVGPLVTHYIEILNEKRKRDASIIEALASAVEAKDQYTAGHSKRVASIASRIATEFDPDLGANEQVRYGFLLHDVGKIGIPEEILKKPEALNSAEWEVIVTHPRIGMNIVSPIGLGAEAEGVVLHHHERWDGMGYPNKLQKTEIPVGARLFAIADTYDAMTSDRPYRAAQSHKSAVKEITLEAGKQFDPAAVDSFLRIAEATS